MTPTIDLADVETIRDAAARVDVQQSTIRKWIQRGQLVPLNPGAPRTLLLSADVDACLDARSTNSRHAARACRNRRAKARYAALP